MRSKNNTTLSTTNVLHGPRFVGATMIIQLYAKFSRRLKPRCRSVTRRIILLSCIAALFSSFFRFTLPRKVIKYRKSIFFFFALLILFIHTFIVSRFAIIIIAVVNNYIKNIHTMEKVFLKYQFLFDY